MAVEVSPPINREEEEEKVIALFSKIIERLSKQAREEFVNVFAEDLKGIISPVAISKARKGKIHLSDRTILNVVLASPRAQKWVLRKAKEEAYQTLEIIEILEKKEPVIEELAKEEEEEAEEE